MMKTRIIVFVVAMGVLLVPFLVFKASQESCVPEADNIAKATDTIITKEQHFVIVVPSYNNEEFYRRNLDSIFSQEYRNFHVVYIDDASTDNTFSYVQQYIEEKGVQRQITLLHNEKSRKNMHNLYTAIHSCSNDTVVVIVEGSDWLYHPHVLGELKQIYANEDVWLTYGQYMRYPDNQIGYCAAVTQNFLKEGRVRGEKWQYSHLHTFYAGLFKRVFLGDFITEGKFFAAWDLAIVFPMLEMAREHAYFIPNVNYVCNCSASPRESFGEQQRIERIIRGKEIYPRLVEHPTSPLVEESCDLIVFSYNRPMQLYAFLESLEKRVSGLNKVTVIVRSDDYFASGYKMVEAAFPSVWFVQQSKTEPRKDFKPLVMEFSFGTRASDASYILYAVDDIVITEHIDIKKDTERLKRTGAYGFYYRLGEGIDYCYTEDRQQGVPALLELDNDLYAWEFSRGKGDWGYPNSVDFVLYAKNELQEMFARLPFSYPNDLEGGWARGVDKHKIGLCHKEAKIVNIPLNLVTAMPNRNLNSYSTHVLNEMFLAGLKIDVDALFQVKHNAAHAHVEIQFVPREESLLEEAFSSG